MVLFWNSPLNVLSNNFRKEKLNFLHLESNKQFMYKKLDIQISILIRLCYLVYLSNLHPLIFLIMILVYFLIPIKDMFLYTKVKVNTNYQPYDNLLYKIPFVGIHVLKSFLPNDFCKIKQYVKSYQKLQS